MKLNPIIKKLFKYILLLGLILVIVFLFIAQPYYINGNSMEPSLSNGETRIGNKLIYRTNLPERGDVVVFISPMNESAERVARIIAIPGDDIRIGLGDVELNGQILVEPYLKEPNSTLPRKFLKYNIQNKLSENEYVIMGDNRAESNDSRDYGFIHSEFIISKIQ